MIYGPMKDMIPGALHSQEESWEIEGSEFRCECGHLRRALSFRPGSGQGRYWTSGHIEHSQNHFLSSHFQKRRLVPAAESCVPQENTLFVMLVVSEFSGDCCIHCFAFFSFLPI